MLHIAERKQIKYREKRAYEFDGFYLRGYIINLIFVADNEVDTFLKKIKAVLKARHRKILTFFL